MYMYSLSVSVCVHRCIVRTLYVCARESAYLHTCVNNLWADSSSVCLEEMVILCAGCHAGLSASYPVMFRRCGGWTL